MLARESCPAPARPASRVGRRRLSVAWGVLTAVAVASALASPAAARWQTVAGPVQPALELGAQSIDGTLHAAFVEHSGSRGLVWVRRLSDDRSQWLPVGSGAVNANLPGSAALPPALLDVGGVPHVAWTQAEPTGPGPSDRLQLRVARFDDATDAWVEVDPGALNINAVNDAYPPSLALLDGVVHVAWSEAAPAANPAFNLYVKRLTNTGWEEPVSGSLNVDPAHAAHSAHLAVSDGRLWVAWAELTETAGSASQIFVRRLKEDGTAWENAAPWPAQNAAEQPAVAGLASAGGTLYLAYKRSFGDDGSLRVSRLADNLTWEAVGGELAITPGSLVIDTALASVGGVPYVAWGDWLGSPRFINTRVKRLTAGGDDWEEPAQGTLNADANLHAIAVAVADVDGDAFALWLEDYPDAPPALLTRRLEPDHGPAEIDFGVHALDIPSPPRSVEFTNSTSKPVHFPPDATTLLGAAAGDFLLVDECSGRTLGRWERCVVAVRFAARDVGGRFATLRLTSDAPGSPHHTLLAGSSPGPAPPPGLPGVSINGGAQFTNDPAVTLDVVWPFGANGVFLSNDGGLAGAVSTPLAAELPWRLDSSGPERLPKTVYARFDSVAFAYSDDIILDETAPLVLSARFVRESTRAAAKPRRRRGVKIRIRARDRTSGVNALQITRRRSRPGKRRPYRRTVAYHGRAGRLWVRVFDRAGNRSNWVRVKR